MAKLKLGTIPDDRPIKLSIELPAAIHRELLSYAEIHAAQTGQAIAPEKLVPHMLTRFMATDRGFAKARRKLHDQNVNAQAKPPPPDPGQNSSQS